MNIDTSSPGSTQSALIHIRVPVSWYEENGLDPSTTSVTHCGDTSSEWEILEVVSSSSDEEYYYFTVQTPGFSEFSVAALPYEEVQEQPVMEDGAESTVQEETGSDEEGPGYLWIIPVAAIILGIVVFVLRKQNK